MHRPCGFMALGPWGIPGAALWNNEWAQYFDGIDTIFAVVEPDAAREVAQEPVEDLGDPRSSESGGVFRWNARSLRLSI